MMTCLSLEERNKTGKLKKLFLMQFSHLASFHDSATDTMKDFAEVAEHDAEVKPLRPWRSQGHLMVC